MMILRRLFSTIVLGTLLLATATRATLEDHRPPEQVEVTATGETVPDNAPPRSVGGECDCTEETEAALERLRAAKEAADIQLQISSDELDEIIEERNRLLEEIKRLRQSLHTARTEMENLRTSVHSEKSSKDSLQQQLLTSQAQATLLKRELEETRAEIKRLNELSFIVQFRKEVVGLWDNVLQFAKDLVVKRN